MITMKLIDYMISWEASLLDSITLRSVSILRSLPMTSEILHDVSMWQDSKTK